MHHAAVSSNRDGGATSMVKEDRTRSRSVRARALHQDPPQHDGIVVLFVVRAEQQRHRLSIGQFTNLIQQCRMLAQFLCLAASELRPAIRIMTEPFAQVVTWRNLFQP